MLLHLAQFHGVTLWRCTGAVNEEDLITRYFNSIDKPTKLHQKQSGFFQNKGIVVQLDELDQLDKVVHAWIRIYLQSHKAQKTL